MAPARKSKVLWDAEWLSQAEPRQRDLWRGVEAQHRVATMHLVDDLAEQTLLEQLIEDSKPRLPPGYEASHFLLATPFRYISPYASRFRRSNDPGVWYGADDPTTVAAEMAHWRWRFFMDSEGLRDHHLVTELTFFPARFSGLELDIALYPWTKHRAKWRNPNDYEACQKLATATRAQANPVQAIRYESARLEAAFCEVVFDVRSLSITSPGVQQTWTCKTDRTRVLLSHDDTRLEFEMP